MPVSTNTRVYDEFVASMPSQAGKTAFVTGSNTGLGFFAAKALAKRGATVVLLCRSVEKAEAAKREMVAELGEGAAIETAHLDLSSLASVRECAAALRARYASCDLLLLNAGLMAVHHDLTEDGHDVQLQVNHLGHFLLAHELLPLLVAAGADGGAPARVVSHASHVTISAGPRFSAATADGPVGGGFRALPLGLAAWVPGASCWARYGQSKLCNVLFTAELQRRLAANGAGVIATAAHPGVAFTQLVQVAAGAGSGTCPAGSWASGGAVGAELRGRVDSAPPRGYGHRRRRRRVLRAGEGMSSARRAATSSAATARTR